MSIDSERFGARLRPDGGRVAFARPPSRVTGPPVPTGDVVVEAPPDVPRVTPASPMTRLIPVVMVVAMVGTVVFMVTSGAAANPTALLFPIMMAVSMLAMFASGGRGGSSRVAELAESRRDYAVYLDRTRAEIERTARAQRDALDHAHPEPASLIALAGSPRMWERRAADPDFLHVRVGLGDQRLVTRLVPPETGPAEDVDPACASMLRELVRARAIVPMLPTAVSLSAFSAVTVPSSERGRAVMRAVVVQAVAFHGPDDLLVVVVAPVENDAWDWVKWVPHHRQSIEGVTRETLRFESVTEAVEAVSRIPAAVRVLLVVDGWDDDADVRRGALGRRGVTVLASVAGTGDSDPVADEESTRTLELVLDGDRLGARSSVGVEMFGRADTVDLATATCLARAMARYRLVSPAVVDSTRRRSGAWVDLPGMTRPEVLDPDLAWRGRSGSARLKVPFGLDENGGVVELDLKEAAEGGMGPHGLCIGATGSGKSELLRTLVLGLIATHSPDVLNLVLVDFKGGATFLGLEEAPQVAAVITNLAEEAHMVERMRDALAGEMNRRQELLRSAGNFANVTDYAAARARGAALDPLPALFVVVDEFSELLSRVPEFADLFVAIGRLGRSLHIHLLLASQRLDEGRLRGLDSHLSYRIGLKTFSPGESRSVLGVPDAYHLTGGPGAGFLKSDAGDPVRFTASFVSGPVEQASGAPAAATAFRAHPPVQLFSATDRAVARVATSSLDRDATPSSVGTPATGPARTLLAAVVDRVSGRGRPAHRVWLPPLDRPVPLDALPDSAADSTIGSVAATIGVVDRPFDQRRDPLRVDLTGAAGHVAVVGGPHSGKSTAVATVLLALARRYPPGECRFVALDFGGGTVSLLRGLPHVAAVAGRTDDEVVRRIVADTAAVVRRREELFRRLGIASMAELRASRHALPDVDTADLILVVDGWSTVRSDFESHEATLTRIATTGLSYGVHLVLTAGRWADIRPAVKDAIGTRVELRLVDPLDSDIGRAQASKVPARPGRGVTSNGLHLLIALPRTDGRQTVAGLTGAVGDAVDGVRARWADVPAAPALRLLPHRLPRAEFLARAFGSESGCSWPPSTVGAGFHGQIPLGVDEDDLAPVHLDLTENPHFLVLGDGRCGKTAVLRALCAGLVDANDAASLRVLVIDYRRTLLDVVPEDRLAGRASSAEEAGPMVVELARHLRTRRPGPDTTKEQLAARSWWTGPDVVVVVDDYDLVVTPTGNPLAELLDLLSVARDVGLHLVVARRAGGAARALYEPVLARLRDLASPGLIMSGNRDEGVLLGAVRPSDQPPGRGTLVDRSSARVVQTAFAEES
ncbi:type VII secretion protein EccCa [Rhodococcoides corynebacterioides]|uniref:type VII secretion protein EccCa n=1 Tax=Rhodococcoides corynebacterioides TaxID=53972 RepID=UPI003ADD176D